MCKLEKQDYLKDFKRFRKFSIMASRIRDNKEILQEIIDKIQELSSITQGRISRLAGFKTENYISEAKSKNDISDNIIKKVKNLYERAKLNPAVLDEANETDAAIKDIPKDDIQNRLLRLEANAEVFQVAIAGLQSKNNEDFLQRFSQLQNMIEEAVKRRKGL